MFFLPHLCSIQGLSMCTSWAWYFLTMCTVATSGKPVSNVSKLQFEIHMLSKFRVTQANMLPRLGFDFRRQQGIFQEQSLYGFNYFHPTQPCGGAAESRRRSPTCSPLESFLVLFCMLAWLLIQFSRHLWKKHHSRNLFNKLCNAVRLRFSNGAWQRPKRSSASSWKVCSYRRTSLWWSLIASPTGYLIKASFKHLSFLQVHFIALLSDPHKGLKAIMKNISSDPDTAQKIISQIRPRFSEWSMACANLQLKKLVDNASGPCFHYMGLFLNDDSQMMSKSSGTITGLLMSKWWDQAPDAGPKRRPQAAFGETMPNLESLTVAKWSGEDSQRLLQETFMFST